MFSVQTLIKARNEKMTKRLRTNSYKPEKMTKKLRTNSYKPKKMTKNMRTSSYKTENYEQKLPYKIL